MSGSSASPQGLLSRPAGTGPGGGGDGVVTRGGDWTGVAVGVTTGGCATSEALTVRIDRTT